jgi:hypothetical protein
MRIRPASSRRIAASSPQYTSALVSPRYLSAVAMRAGIADGDHVGTGCCREAAGRGRSDADWPNTAIEPCDIYRTLRSRTQAVRGDQTGSRQALLCRSILV